MIWALLVLAAFGLWTFVWAVERPGPNAAIVLWQRYGLGLLAAPSAVALAALAVAAPQALATAAGITAGGLLLIGAAQPATIRCFVRRCRVRAQWPSVCRTAKLASEDRRPHKVPGGVEVRINEGRIEWLPRIWRGRAIEGGAGARWDLRSARGRTVNEIAEHAQTLADSLGVALVTVADHGKGRGQLTVRWEDPK